MNAKKLVVAALSASMILTATPAFAKEETKTVKYTAEQQYIINLLEQAVVNGKVNVANAKKSLADAEKALDADTTLTSAKILVQAREYDLKVAQDALATYAKNIDSELADLIKNFNENGNSVDSYQAKVDKAEKAYKDAVVDKALKTVKAGATTVTVEGLKTAGLADAVNGKDVKTVESVLKEKAMTGEERAIIEAGLKVAKENVAKEEANQKLADKVNETEKALGEAKEKLDAAKKANAGYDEALTKALEAKWTKENEIEYAKLKKAVDDADAKLAAAKVAYAEAVAKSETGKKVIAAKEALKAAEDQLAHDQKALEDAKAGESNKELVVDGTNGKKQVPNTADAE